MDYTEQEEKALQNIRRWIAEHDFFPGSVGPNTATYLYRLIQPE